MKGRGPEAVAGTRFFAAAGIHGTLTIRAKIGVVTSVAGRLGMKPIRLVYSLLALLLLAACANLPAPTAGPQPSQLILDSGDQVQVTVLGQTDLTGTYTIDAAGAITMPLIGSVSARGRTTQSLASAVAAALRNGYLVNPDVTVQVAQFRPIFVLGEVGNPGQYTYVVGLTVQQAVALAGGFTARANQNTVDVTRAAGGNAIALKLHLGDAILPGDTITVRQRLF
jgi:polysaccharide export outer membrane protein